MSSPLKSAVFIPVSSLLYHLTPLQGPRLRPSCSSRPRVCSLFPSLNFRAIGNHARCEKCFGHCAFTCQGELRQLLVQLSRCYFGIGTRSEERRVGKECRS